MINKTYTANEKIRIIEDYFDSKLSIYKFSIERGLGKSTLYRWLEQYNSIMMEQEMEQETQLDLKQNFIPILNDVKNNIEDKNILNMVDMKINGIKVSFDISLLGKVIEVLK